MRYAKGQSGNPAGRPRGVPNKVTGEIRQVLTKALAGQARELPGLFKQLSPEQRIEALARLMQYVVPRLKEVEVVGDVALETGPDLDRNIRQLISDWQAIHE